MQPFPLGAERSAEGSHPAGLVEKDAWVTRETLAFIQDGLPDKTARVFAAEPVEVFLTKLGWCPRPRQFGAPCL
jgi:hypothetical protein